MKFLEKLWCSGKFSYYDSKYERITNSDELLGLIHASEYI